MKNPSFINEEWTFDLKVNSSTSIDSYIKQCETTKLIHSTISSQTEF